MFDKSIRIQAGALLTSGRFTTPAADLRFRLQTHFDHVHVLLDDLNAILAQTTGLRTSLSSCSCHRLASAAPQGVTMSFTAMPNEILEMIIALYANDRSQLDRLSRVNRPLRTLCQKELFRTFGVVEDGIRRYSTAKMSRFHREEADAFEYGMRAPRIAGLFLQKALSEVVPHPSHVLEHVTSLSLHLRWPHPLRKLPALAEIIDMCPRVRTLTVHWSGGYPTTRDMLSCFSSLAGKQLETLWISPALPVTVYPFQQVACVVKHLCLSLYAEAFSCLKQADVAAAPPLKAERVTLKSPPAATRKAPLLLGALCRISPPTALDLDSDYIDATVARALADWAGSSIEDLRLSCIAGNGYRGPDEPWAEKQAFLRFFTAARALHINTGIHTLLCLPPRIVSLYIRDWPMVGRSSPNTESGLLAALLDHAQSLTPGTVLRVSADVALIDKRIKTSSRDMYSTQDESAAEQLDKLVEARTLQSNVSFAEVVRSTQQHRPLWAKALDAVRAKRLEGGAV